MTVPFMKTGNTVSILAQGKWYQVKPEHPNYDAILEALHGTEEDIIKLIDVSSSLESYLDGNVEVVGGSVLLLVGLCNSCEKVCLLSR